MPVTKRLSHFSHQAQSAAVSHAFRSRNGSYGSGSELQLGSAIRRGPYVRRNLSLHASKAPANVCIAITVASRHFGQVHSDVRIAIDSVPSVQASAVKLTERVRYPQ